MTAHVVSLTHIHTCRYGHGGILVGIQQSFVALVAIVNMPVLQSELFLLLSVALPHGPTILPHAGRERCLSSSLLFLVLPCTLGGGGGGGGGGGCVWYRGI